MKDGIQLVLFDLGSTLFYERGPWDSLYQKADKALWEALQKAGVPLEARRAYGSHTNLIELYYAEHRGDLNEPTSRAVLNRLLQGQGYPLEDEELRAALRSMYAVTQANWSVEQDAIPTLEALKNGGLRIGAISNAADNDNTQALIDAGGLRPYLEHIVSSAVFGKRKPHPEIFKAGLGLFGLRADQAVMVGDDYEADIVGAEGVGMKSVWITRRVRGPVTVREEAQPLVVVSALSAIPAILTGK